MIKVPGLRVKAQPRFFLARLVAAQKPPIVGTFGASSSYSFDHAGSAAGPRCIFVSYGAYCEMLMQHL